VGVLVDINPADTTYKFAALIQYLEKAISAKIGSQIAFDVRIYRDWQAAADDLKRGELYFIRMPRFYTFKAARPTRAFVHWSVSATLGKHVIFARKDNGVQNLTDLRVDPSHLANQTPPSRCCARKLPKPGFTPPTCLGTILPTNSLSISPAAYHPTRGPGTRYNYSKAVSSGSF
jgi:hypothetical protein